MTFFFLIASNFSMIPIRWLLTVDSEIAFFSFSIRSLRVCLFSFKNHAVQEKLIAKLVNSKENLFEEPVSYSSLRDSCEIGF